MTNIEYGNRRYKYRYKIREYLDAQKISMSELGRRIGLSCQAVSETIRGQMNSPRILNALRELGVPEKYLFDPHQSA